RGPSAIATCSAGFILNSTPDPIVFPMDDLTLPSAPSAEELSPSVSSWRGNVEIGAIGVLNPMAQDKVSVGMECIKKTLKRLHEIFLTVRALALSLRYVDNVNKSCGFLP